MAPNKVHVPLKSGTEMVSGVSKLEKMVATAPATVNNLNGYGFPEDGCLNSFLSMAPGNYESAQHLYYGMRDMENGRGIPHEIYQVMNTAEIAAMFIGNAVLKIKGKVKIRQGEVDREIEYLRLKYEPVEGIISELVVIGFQYNAIRRMQKKGFSKYETGKDSLKRRISALPESTKKMFLLPFNRKMAISNRDNREGFDFYDPNCDETGNSPLDYRGALTYTTQVKSYMKDVCTRNSQAIKT